MQGALTGIYVDEAGLLRTAWRDDAGVDAFHVEPFQPWLWGRDLPIAPSGRIDELQGPGAFRYRVRFPVVGDYRAFSKEFGREWDSPRPLENQALLDRRWRLFGGLAFRDLRRVRLAVRFATGETDPDVPSDPAADRLFAIALGPDNAEPHVLLLEEDTDAAERQLLKSFGDLLHRLDPDVIEAHEAFNGALSWLSARCRRFRVKRSWGRFEAEAWSRATRLRVAERWIDFLRCDLPGRTVFDTFLAAQTFDVSSREMEGYDLAEVAAQLDVTSEDEEFAPLVGPAVREAFFHDRAAFLDNLRRELVLTRGVADLLLPTYVAQAQTFPMILQEVCLRGSAAKVDALLLEEYHQAHHALPDYPEVNTYEGGYTASFAPGVHRRVLHFDVASLYPSLLLAIGRNPAGDSLGIFIPLLCRLREYRLATKGLAQEATDPALRAEYQARQTSFKILINSFYGYLGFPGARFADGDLAAEVTRQGRELLKSLIARFEALGCPVLEADTDGLYVAAGDYFDHPERLLALVADGLPAGISLEFDGRYESMFCYKAKNYALYDGQHVTIRGSALRSRGLEPFLRQLNHALIHHLLGVSQEPLPALLERLAADIACRALPVEQLAKGEHLSMSPTAYERKMAAGGKPRRASLEAALRMRPPPRMGQKVSYFLRPKRKGESNDWQRAEPLAAHHPVDRPYDPDTYLKKLRDWEKRYAEFL